MSNIAAGDVTYTLLKQRTLADSRKSNLIQLAFGNGALTYPAGGIPIVIGNLGCPVVVESLVVTAKGTSGYGFSYDRANSKLVMTQAAAHAHDIFVVGGLTADEPMAINASVKMSKNAATNRTIAGVNSATNGGVMSTSPGAGAEPSTVAIAAQTIEVEVIGY